MAGIDFFILNGKVFDGLHLGIDIEKCLNVIFYEVDVLFVHAVCLWKLNIIK